ncbi:MULTISPECIES: NAD(P)H-dependent oxidoreductase [unclassified Micromonospora]|uniref:NADPH-dependent FMN reductase n=1 Tax=unclassified Micromonospora TaxID=2617518 RepID=UPI001C23C62B|nr:MULTISPECIES: NAD(P)H-dependent oxidoreductase [unclassified Micromonospora]MBU8860043.1 NAD(P)H-dependent oxidoreductase [Micromonospora sp. WMMB482]MBU8861900.1 NAD(P)H-dependent oxidoreductase [Micromonospora sp. WMMB482]MDM4777802.1 NAD(P)H-dependent oxidoreductase [Micromonospora sp. b486]MDM4779572.1 NAD(P)H-dependent oxidoreductase [Micromonospora sp. b486]
MSTTQRTGPVRIGLIVGSTRPGRRGAAVAGWAAQVCSRHPAVRAGSAEIEVIDLAEQALPLLDEPVPAMFGDYRQAHTRRWSAVVAACDAFVFVTPEYNHSIPAALKNAVDYLYAEWNDKVAGLLGYGVQGGLRATDHLRLILAEVHVVVVPTAVSVPIFTDFDFSGSDPGDPTAPGILMPGADREESFSAMLTEILTWSAALRTAVPAADGSPELVG